MVAPILAKLEASIENVSVEIYVSSSVFIIVKVCISREELRLNVSMTETNIGN
jgi:hypothetical protein